MISAHCVFRENRATAQPTIGSYARMAVQPPLRTNRCFGALSFLGAPRVASSPGRCREWDHLGHQAPRACRFGFPRSRDKFSKARRARPAVCMHGCATFFSDSVCRFLGRDRFQCTNGAIEEISLSFQIRENFWSVQVFRALPGRRDSRFAPPKV
jgi:hypothetical protein